MNRLTQRKGQAAMEFLMTYGWAILAAIIAIGVLAYFGVFNLTPPDIFTINTPFVAGTHNALDSEVINFELTQNRGESITLANTTGTDRQGITVSMRDGSGTCTNVNVSSVSSNVTQYAGGTFGATITHNQSWPTGEKITFIADCNNVGDWSDGDSVRADLDVKYFTSGSTVESTSSGEIVAVVVPA